MSRLSRFYANEKTPLEVQIKNDFETEFKRLRMQNELNKYSSKRDASGGMIWTVGDLQNFFRDTDKRRRRK